ncbi:SRPBCC domain-containing protein [Streptomyces sp. NPDC056956]|uniref:SRPBCC domain-containing protein n=2 Tax=unclassified Streptomyces TaxID=2593676 RepID=A0A6G3QTJ3_9ACTN|nr:MULTISPECIES: SRPBCC domain-containing protein [unclassified Streptomyces]NEA86823.1 SRPBCC domain-containing protein [Streptomyces sp. SID14436]NEC82151.1 SRPBCC domain-containing protein [Streptomyces sp. SID7958]
MSTEQTPRTGPFSYALTRTLDAPAETVWRAWTTPDEYARWAYAVPGSVEMDVRPGGAWKATVATPDGDRVPLTGSYQEVAEPRLLVLGMDRPGGADPSTMAMELDARDDYRTTIVLRQTCDTAEERDMAEQGSTLLLDSLATYLDQNATRS